jgi:three-Cys-motif partner protein
VNAYVNDPSDNLPARRVRGWAHRKHHFVRRYMDAFATGMRKWDQRVYIDLFAGPGKCFEREPSSLFFPGSPLIALDFPFTQHVYVESDHLAADALRQRAPGSSTRRVTVIEDDCNSAVPTILGLLPARGLFLAFIDPTNWQIRYDTVAELTAGRPMDLIVTFMVGEMKRVPPKAVAAALDAFFGTNEWRTLKRRMQVDFVELYRAQLAKLGYISRAPRHDLVVTNTKNLPLYQLCFFSKHAKGYELWDNVTAIDEKGQRRLGTG